MALRTLFVALSMIASSVSAATAQTTPTTAPPGTEATKYCLRVEAVTGSRLETVECWTRQEWAEQGVDVDREWAKEGVRVLA
jgi:hypothetical protein